ncbi:hypothetical protein BpHYR1_008085 [Brachionus plicatilis]|uniref:Uncharacterized protein n=1 Tax=Brachionus plicatilis TaxID=10195 RepID=A0A3M7Q3H5_BRAPC|nr:hypothetical protein BpHYR1_008085 [Brachionus plicatilis]
MNVESQPNSKRSSQSTCNSEKSSQLNQALINKLFQDGLNDQKKTGYSPILHFFEFKTIFEKKQLESI